MSFILCASGAAETCKAYAILDFGRGFPVLGWNGGISVFGDVPYLCREHTLVFCSGCFSGRRNYLSVYAENWPKIHEKTVAQIKKTR